MSDQTFNPSGPGGPTCISLIGVGTSSGAVKDFVTPSNTLTQDTGAPGGPTGSGTYGPDFRLYTKDSFDEYGWTLGTPPSFAGGTGQPGVTAFIAFNTIGSPGASSSFYLYEQNATTLGSYATIAFKASVGALTPIVTAGSTNKLTGTAQGAGTAFTVAASGSFGASNTWSLYINGALSTSSALVNTGATAPIGRIGGQNGQGNLGGSTGVGIAYAAFFNSVLSSTDISNLHASLTGGGAFGLLTPGTPSTQSHSQFFLDNARPNLPALAAAPLAGLGWLIERRNRVPREEWQQDKNSRLFLPSWVRK